MSQFRGCFKSAAASQVVTHYKVKGATKAKTQELVTKLLKQKRYIYPDIKVCDHSDHRCMGSSDPGLIGQPRYQEAL